MRNSKERERRGRGEREGSIWGIVTAGHTNVSLEAQCYVRVKLLMCWGGTERPVPACRAVKDQRLSVK